MQRSILFSLAIVPTLLSSFVSSVALAQDLPKWEDVSKDYEKIVTTPDGQSLFALYAKKKDDQALAELPRGWEKMKFLLAATPSGGVLFSGLHGPTRYAFWRQFGNRLALVEPQLEVRSTGEQTSKDSVRRIFTDTVILEVPIACMGPNGQPVIDLDAMLVGQSQQLAGISLNVRLAKLSKLKSFPQNLEIAIEAPDQGGTFKSLHYSISQLPDNPDYKPRLADDRIGFFTTDFKDLGLYGTETNMQRYIHRWNVEKREAKLSLSPPKEPIVFYIEHTIPVRYRRYVRDGILQWNAAFEQIGIDNAIEVYQQDELTGAHMDKDPEDVRYNFIRWLNNDVSTAIGPSRVNPNTGQILDADVVLTDGWIRAFYNWYEEKPMDTAQSLSADTLTWLEKHAEWDPRIQLLAPSARQTALEDRMTRVAAGDLDPADSRKDPALAASPELREVHRWFSSQPAKCTSPLCFAAHGMAMDMAVANMALESFGAIGLNADPATPEVEMLDGVPEAFVGPQVAHLVAHEVGHTLGLRHNFKGSSIYTLDQINSADFKGKKPIAASVMDYMATNFNVDKDNVQGDYTMIGIGPYDMWAMEYGYTDKDPTKVAAKVGEPGHVYLTDEDTLGPDPLARRYDFSADPLEYANAQMALIKMLRENLITKYVKDGDSWERARKGYSKTLAKQRQMIDMMSAWVGGTHVSRVKKGDANTSDPLKPVPAAQQRSALQFIIANAFNDAAFGLTPEIANKMSFEKWGDIQSFTTNSAWAINDAIAALQNGALTLVLNPATLSRVYDNEFRASGDDDAVTMPEVIDTVCRSIFTEIDDGSLGSSNARKPVISTWRRNAQADLTDRLCKIATGNAGMPPVVRQLASAQLRRLNTELQAMLKKANSGNCDAYTLAHLEDLQARCSRALDAIMVAN
ncbi:MAG: DUF5117 domain-containing protein [Phycisphaerales bacterium]|nr:DUF5117 domain-containing protein [Phycisphaerales bacterium]